ncbi:MAG TPA: Uma2 family endonuclease [Thermoanaerobaculia bacterium]|nr:Uma2 family endonuclease [Thermoanaerobaculia bacterium]
MALHERSVRLTYDDYVLFPEDGLRHEIIDGEHSVTPAPYPRHQNVVLRFALTLGPFAEANRAGQLFVSPIDVLLSRHDVVQPDLVFVSRDRLHIITERNLQGAPDLVIEVLSEGTRRRDEGLKLATYERFEVGEAWLADPARKTVTVYRLDNGRYRRIAELSAQAGDLLTTPLLPGLEIDLAAIFA